MQPEYCTKGDGSSAWGEVEFRGGLSTRQPAINALDISLYRIFPWNWS